MTRFVSVLLVCAIVCSRASAQQAPLPVDVALAELHRIQLREPELWRERSKHCVGCGIAGVVTGIPAATVLLPMGALFISFADYDYYEDDPYYENQFARSDRIIGSVFLLAGLCALVLAGWGIHKIIKERRPRAEANRELRSFTEQRTLLERILESQVTNSPR